MWFGYYIMYVFNENVIVLVSWFISKNVNLVCLVYVCRNMGLDIFVFISMFF